MYPTFKGPSLKYYHFFFSFLSPYSAMIMRMSGVSSDQAVMWMVVGVSGLFLVGQLITLCTVRRFNRRTIFLSHVAGKPIWTTLF